jgi:hypothetical protein
MPIAIAYHKLFFSFKITNQPYRNHIDFSKNLTINFLLFFIFLSLNL